MYGGQYGGDIKDSKDFKYVLFSELPTFTPAHRSAMAKFLTAEVECLCIYCLSILYLLQQGLASLEQLTSAIM